MTKKSNKKCLVRGNNVYILGEFDFSLIENVIIELKELIDKLTKLKDGQKITFYINSNGGYSDILFPIVDLIEEAKKNDIIIETHVSRKAYSCGSLLAITGTKGYRFINERAEHVVHYGRFGGHRLETPKQIDRTSSYYKRYLKTIINHYKKYSNVPELEKQVEDDYFFIPAKQCVKWGLADKII